MAKPSQEHLEKTLNRFQIQDICDIALHIFPEITWEEIQEQIIQNKNMAITKKVVIKIILNAVKDLPDNEIEERASKLTLYYMGQTETKTWTALRLKNKIDDNTNEKNNQLENLKSCVRRKGILADVNMIKFNSKYIISISKKNIRKNRGVVKQLPTFLQYFPRQPYIFCSRKNFDTDLILAVVYGFGYNQCELCHLTGPNVLDLLTILRNKEGGVSRADLIETVPDLQPEVQVTEGVTNYSQYAKRAKYAEHLYGKKPPKLQQISITVKDDVWHTSNNNFPEMEGTSIKGMELMIRSPNVVEFIKEMIAKGVVTTPIPPYMAAILTGGKNEIKISQT